LIHFFHSFGWFKFVLYISSLNLNENSSDSFGKITLLEVPPNADLNLSNLFCP
jgi:hypothetical protein